MGCNMSSDKLEVRSPFISCLIEHCSSSCMKKKIEEIQEVPQKIIENAVSAIQDIKIDVSNNNNNIINTPDTFSRSLTLPASILPSNNNTPQQSNRTL
jgi:hypothetical protein